MVQYMWGKRSSWHPDNWELPMAVMIDGRAVGVQSAFARDFNVTRTLETGSWFGLPYQGRGTGTEMRAAILHFAFERLGTIEALSGAFHDNDRSHAVSRSSGYVENGRRWVAQRRTAGRMILLRLDRASWEQQRRHDISVHGLADCRAWFGIHEHAGAWDFRQQSSSGQRPSTARSHSEPIRTTR
jgi:RimJ/RimL family protein N-acetyltransferase